MIVIAAVTVILIATLKTERLVLSDAETGEIFIEERVKEGDEFSVTFRHSINKTDVTEIYEVRDGEIWLTGCVYYSFGAGVAEDLDPDWTLAYGNNGEMILSGLDREMTDLTYVVGTVYDHMLTLHGEQINLRQLCGRNTRVHFSIS